MISVQEARDLIFKHSNLMDTIWCAPQDVLNTCLSEDVMSKVSIPAFPQSAMDGYALSGDHDSYELVGEAKAGTSEEQNMNDGEAYRIFTGAPVPLGADRVLMQEHAVVDGNELSIGESYKCDSGQNIRPQGSEVQEGALGLEKGSLINPAAIGLLSMMGYTKIPVHRLPSVAILLTGDELRKPGELLEFGQVYESNSASLKAALNQFGINDVHVMHVKDDRQATIDGVASLLEDYDMILVSGGISVGDYDFVSEALDVNGVQRIFHKIKQKPGKPMYFGTHENACRIFALPGNPASALVCYYEYVLPSIKKSLAWTDCLLPVKFLKADREIKNKIGRAQFIRAFQNEEQVHLTSGQESYKMQSFALADALIYLPEETEFVEVGQKVEVHIIS